MRCQPFLVLTLAPLVTACGGKLAASLASDAAASVDARPASPDATVPPAPDAAYPPDALADTRILSMVDASDAAVPLFPVQAPRLRAGGDDTCYVGSHGHVACWGSNETGQLATGDFTDLWAPTWISGFRDVTDLALGDFSLCVRHLDGSIACAGTNASGELGTATATCAALGNPCSDVLVAGPVIAPGPLAAGVSYFCAVAGGGLRCWGAAPSFDTTGYDARAVAGGDTHLCVLFSAAAAQDPARNVICFGASAAGELGTGLAGDASAAGAVGPVATGTAGGFVELAAGYGFTCGVGAGGDLSCWGDDTYGGLGQGPSFSGVCLSNVPEGVLSTSCATEPAIVPGLPPIAHLAARYGQACAVTTTGEVYCWGTPSQTSPASLGSCAITTAGCAPPTQVSGITGATSIAVGLGHACALDAAGNVLCWGLDTHGQLGHGPGGPTFDPTPHAVVLPAEPP